MSNGAMTARSIVGDRREGRPKDDFYPTPPEAVHALLEAEKFNGGIWEPACGDGAISRTLEKIGYTVISTDLYNHGYGISGIDFLRCQNLRAENIVTNPPFILAEGFITHSISLGMKKLALLLKLSALEGSRRSSIMRETHLTRVHVFENRINFYRNGGTPTKNGGMIAFAWFVWERGYTGKPELGWIRADPQPGLFA